MTTFKRLEISKWQQFEAIEIDFDKRVTILTGANGSGKTTLLNQLARHAGWQPNSLSVPFKDRASTAFRWLSRIFGDTESSNDTIGQVFYGDGTRARLSVPPNMVGAAYQVSLENQQPVECIFIPSHRSTYRYAPVSQIPTSVPDKNQAYGRVHSSFLQTHLGHGGNNPSVNYHMKEVLISWSIFGRGNVDMEPQPQLIEFYEGFQGVLRRLLPETLGFQKFAIRNQEVVLVCSSGDFLLDAASGGVSTLISLAWSIFMYTPPGTNFFTTIIDEVENHLHPTMQRRLLTDLTSAFPNVGFIVSTHSPLIVNSFRDAGIYALRYRAPSNVMSLRLDMQNQARTATQILDEVLGVSTTMPLWAEEEINGLVRQFTQGPLDEESFQRLRAQMKQLGLGDYMPQALGQILDAKK